MGLRWMGHPKWWVGHDHEAAMNGAPKMMGGPRSQGCDEWGTQNGGWATITRLRWMGHPKWWVGHDHKAAMDGAPKMVGGPRSQDRDGWGTQNDG
jgi:hypothetical protein